MRDKIIGLLPGDWSSDFFFITQVITEVVNSYEITDRDTGRLYKGQYNHMSTALPPKRKFFSLSMSVIPKHWKYGATTRQFDKPELGIIFSSNWDAYKEYIPEIERNCERCLIVSVNSDLGDTTTFGRQDFAESLMCQLANEFGTTAYVVDLDNTEFVIPFEYGSVR